VESNLGLRGKRPATNRVKYGMAGSFIIIIIIIIIIIVATGISIWLLLELLFSNHDLSLNVGTIRVTQSRVHWRAFVNTVTNILVP
jgi:hypothetical protein